MVVKIKYFELLKILNAIPYLNSLESEESLIIVHKYLALNYIAFNIKEKAYQEFKKIFFIKPNYKLEESYSPVVMEVFNKAREDATLTSVLFIDSEPSGAEVLLDGNFIGHTPLKKEFLFNRYLLEVKHFGYLPKRSRIRLNSEESSLGKIVLDEANFFSRYKEGMAFYNNGEYETALNIFFDVIQEARDFADVYLMIGLSYSNIPGMEYEGINWIKKKLTGDRSD